MSCCSWVLSGPPEKKTLRGLHGNQALLPRVSCCSWVLSGPPEKKPFRGLHGNQASLPRVSCCSWVLIPGLVGGSLALGLGFKDM